VSGDLCDLPSAVVKPAADGSQWAA
jgi:hypothetical protein